MMEAKEARAIYAKQYNLPQQADNAIARLRKVVSDAHRFGMPEVVDYIWDAVITEAQADALEKGGSIGFGDGRGD